MAGGENRKELNFLTPFKHFKGHIQLAAVVKIGLIFFDSMPRERFKFKLELPP